MPLVYLLKDLVLGGTEPIFCVSLLQIATQQLHNSEKIVILRAMKILFFPPPKTIGISHELHPERC